MTKRLSPAVRDVFETRDGYTVTDGTAAVTTTVFESAVGTVEADAEWAHRYVVSITVPTLSAAIAGAVGQAVESGWLDTLERRLEDAPKATRATVELEAFDVTASDEEVLVSYEFTSGTPEQAADIAKTFVEYVEGTYVEGIVPGYDYLPPISKLLQQAQSGGSESERGGTPL